MLTSHTHLSRRQVLELGLGGGLALGTPSLLLGDEPSETPDFKARFDAAFSGYDVPHFDLPGHFEDGRFVARNLQWASDGLAVKDPHIISSFQSVQEPQSQSACVLTLEEGRAACHAALRSGHFDEARIAVAQYTTDSHGRPQLVFSKDQSGLVAPSAIYRDPTHIGKTGLDRRADSEWNTMLATAGGDGASALSAVQRYDAQLWTPEQELDLNDPFMYAGLFDRRSEGYGNCRLQTCRPQCARGQQRCGYSYGVNCRSGNCNLRPLGTVGGLLRGEFLRPLSSTGGIRHLPFGKRIVARLFPRLAYQNGWVNCETAHLLLVKRLFWAIVIGVSLGVGGAGAGAGGGSTGGGAAAGGAAAGGGGGGGIPAAIIFLG